jgi:hypothetical protein
MHLETSIGSNIKATQFVADLSKINPLQAVQLINCCVGKFAMSGWILADIGSEK